MRCYQLTAEIIDGGRDELMAWAEQHGFDPRRVPVDAAIIVDGGQVAIDYLADPLRHTPDGEALRETAVSTLIALPPLTAEA